MGGGLSRELKLVVGMVGALRRLHLINRECSIGREVVSFYGGEGAMHNVVTEDESEV